MDKTIIINKFYIFFINSKYITNFNFVITSKKFTLTNFDSKADKTFLTNFDSKIDKAKSIIKLNIITRLIINYF